MHVRATVGLRVVAPLLGGAVTGRDAARAASAPDPWVRWAAAVALGGFGHYAAAAALLGPLWRDLRAGPAVRAHAAITRASHLRQLGGHTAAARLDAAALRLALPPAAGGAACCAAPDDAAPDDAVPDDGGPEAGSSRWGLDVAAATTDALTGLAADALGRFDAATAGVLLGRAGAWCGPPGSRTRVRHGWVRAETALVAGDPGAALVAADEALAGARALGSARHVLKSRLVRAVAAGVAGEDRTSVLAELDTVAADALRTGHLPLHRPALLAAADLAGPVRVPAAGPPPNGAGGGPDAGECAARTGHPAADQATRPGPGHADAGARHAGASQSDTRSRQTDAESRRHAVLHTVSVLYTRSDGTGRDLLRE